MGMSTVKRSMITAVCAALCVVLPAAIGAVPSGTISGALRLPVLICGLVCGAGYGALCGVIGTLISAVITGNPALALLPAAMAECLCCGIVSGLTASALHTGKIYADTAVATILAILVGCICGGTVQAILFAPEASSLTVWIAGRVIAALPDALIQLILIPLIIKALAAARLIPYEENASEK
jgi:hypothetical protein